MSKRTFISIAELIQYLGKGKTMIYQYISSGKIEKVKDGYIIKDESLLSEAKKYENADIISFLKEEIRKKDQEISSLQRKIGRLEALLEYLNNDYQTKFSVYQTLNFKK